MKSKFFSVLVICLATLAIDSTLEAAYRVQGGRLVEACEAPTMSNQAHFEAGAVAYEACDWPEAAKHFNIVTINFPTSSYGQEAFYFLGVSLFFQQEYDHANSAFTDYLKVQANPRYFQSTVEFKFAIAEHLNSGCKRRLLGSKKLPKWACGLNLALEIYDEVIATVPCSDLAAEALISKACLQWRMQNYRPAVDSFQMVIRRFPKHEKTPDCYIYIGKIYLEQSRFEFQNSDILAFANINARKFERDFPRDERICEAQDDVKAIMEIYANGLYETGLFYERICKPRASMIYYHDAIRQFPDTCVADVCRARILCLNPSYCEATASVTGENESEDDDETNDAVDIDLNP
ncbi:MAG TPA: tetratricopeptide repeat protein [Parachlamydiaceae bacterium]|nr:tetratricopeptide repeat protein [Parachlamydiaceae bacterium]